MAIVKLNASDSNQIKIFYSISDIYELIWAFMRYAFERSSKNIWLKLCVRSGNFELHDDGDSLDLNDLNENSALINHMKLICRFSISSRNKIGLTAMSLTNDGTISSSGSLGAYRNNIKISDFYQKQYLRTEFAANKIDEFEKTLKIVMIENLNVEWKYECSDSKSFFNIKMKTKQLRFKCLFDSKQILEFGCPSCENIETIARLRNRSVHFVCLVRGLPNEMKIHNNLIPLKDLLYINFKTFNQEPSQNIAYKKSNPNYKSIELKKRRYISARDDNLRGVPEFYEEFRVGKPLSDKKKSKSVGRKFLSDIIVIGQFDRKVIVAKRRQGLFEEIWLFDQHACSERINLEKILSDNKGVNKITREEANMIACKTAIKFGDYLELETQKNILKSLSECNEPFHCAHGRPTCWLLAKLEFKSFESNSKGSAFRKVAESHKKTTDLKPKGSLPAYEDKDFGKRLIFSDIEKKSKEEKAEGYITEHSRRSADEIRKEEYNRRLRKDPQNVQLWMEFIGMQDVLLEQNSKNLLNVTRKKISILKKAIEHNSECMELILMHLKLSEEVEDLPAVMKLWDAYLKNLPTVNEIKSLEISLDYLNYVRRRFLGYNFDQVNKAFADIIFKFRNSSFEAITVLYDSYFEFLDMAGYSERIIALIQVLIEISVEKLNYDCIDLDAIEDQWECFDSERLGDKVFRHEIKSVFFPDFIFDSGSSNSIQKWLKLERYRQKYFWHHLHFSEDDDCLDPEGRIIFDDLKEYLYIAKSKEDARKMIYFLLDKSFNILLIDSIKLWVFQLYVDLCPVLKDNFKYFERALLLAHSVDAQLAETFGKQVLSTYRDSYCLYIGYYRFQKRIGNELMAEKTIESLKKRGLLTSDMLQNYDILEKFEPSSSSSSHGFDMNTNKYDILRENPGNKRLYMELIDHYSEFDPKFSIEIYNLMVEQQLRMHSIMEEVEEPVSTNKV